MVWTHLGLGLLLIAGCAAGREPTSATSAVSPVPLAAERPLETVAPLPRVEIFYGEGDCAPRLPHGMRGTCIDNRPCNGFGFRDASGRIECACFATTGGCSEDQVCSLRARACVPAAQGDWKRTPAP